MKWRDNDALARETIAEGHRYERAIAERLRAAGLSVDIGPQSVREDVDQAMRGDYAGTVDLHVEGWAVQVKSRRLRQFLDPLYLCSARAWKHDGPTTDLWICVSQITGEAVCVSGRKARENSIERRSTDRRRGIEEYSVRVLALRYWSPLDVAIKWLRDRKGAQ